MLNAVKSRVLSAGMTLIQSPAVGKLMESEAFGTAVEKAMTLPIKLSATLMAQKERVVSLFELATREDLDDLRRSLARMEDALRDIRRDSSQMLDDVRSAAEEKTPLGQ